MTGAARSILLLTAVAYLAITVAIGVWSHRHTRTARDFFIAGQRLGVVVTGLAMMTAAFSGFVFVGGPGLTYRIGVASLFICVPVSFTGGLLAWVVGEKLRSLASDQAVLTVPDAIFARYRSRAASGLAAVAILFGSISYLGAQLLALGIVLRFILDADALLGPWGGTAATLLGLAIVLLYSVIGGMVAGVYTDLFQGLLMIGTAILVFLAALEAGGGLPEIVSAISGSEDFGPRFLDPVGTVPATTAFGFFFVFGIGVLGQPHMLHKFYMLRDPAALRWMPLVLGGSQMLCVLIWLGIGLAVPALVANGALAALADPDSASALFVLSFTPPVLAGLVFAGILAAVMSTADSFINLGAAAIVRDLPRAFGRPFGNELLWGRIAAAAVSLAALALALAFDDLVALLGTFAFGTFAAALAPALAVGLNWDRVTGRAAALSIAVGTVANLVLELARRAGAISLANGTLPATAALALSFAVLLAASLVDRSPVSAPQPSSSRRPGSRAPACSPRAAADTSRRA